MKTLLVFCAIVGLLLGNSTANAAGSLNGRGGYGPVTMSAASTCYPSDTGFTVSGFDGDMTVSSYTPGTATDLTWNIQVTTFKASEDGGNASFVNILASPHTENPAIDTIQGPIERMRFCIVNCSNGTCTTHVKVQGRVAP